MRVSVPYFIKSTILRQKIERPPPTIAKAEKIEDVIEA